MHNKMRRGRLSLTRKYFGTFINAKGMKRKIFLIHQGDGFVLRDALTKKTLIPGKWTGVCQMRDSGKDVTLNGVSVRA